MPEGIPESGQNRFEGVDENTALQILEEGGDIAPEEQQQLIDAITNPVTSYITLGRCKDVGRMLTKEQENKLLDRVMSDSDAVQEMLIMYKESGVTPDADEERWLAYITKGTEENKEE